MHLGYEQPRLDRRIAVNPGLCFIWRGRSQNEYAGELRVITEWTGNHGLARIQQRQHINQVLMENLLSLRRLRASPLWPFLQYRHLKLDQLGLRFFLLLRGHEWRHNVG